MRAAEMPKYVVQTAFPDGWRCESHYVNADSVEAACALAVEAAGTAEEAWVSCEPGETVVDQVVELCRGERISHTVPDVFSSEVRTSASPAELSVTIALIEQVIDESGSMLRPETLFALSELLTTLRAPGTR